MPLFPRNVLIVRGTNSLTFRALVVGILRVAATDTLGHGE